MYLRKVIRSPFQNFSDRSSIPYHTSEWPWSKQEALQALHCAESLEAPGPIIRV